VRQQPTFSGSASRSRNSSEAWFQGKTEIHSPRHAVPIQQAHDSDRESRLMGNVPGIDARTQAEALLCVPYLAVAHPR
jgi:hypothetical protein